MNAGKGQATMSRHPSTGHVAQHAPLRRCDAAGDGRARHTREEQGILSIRNIGGTRGFTLVELIVAFSVSLIVIAITTALLISGTNMAQHTTRRALDEQTIDGVFSFAENRMRFAASVEKRESSELASTQQETGDFLYIGDAAGNPVERGVLFFRHEADGAAPRDVMGEAYYRDNTISLDARVIQKAGARPAVYLKISLYDRDGVLVAERAQTYTLINGEKAEADAADITITSPDFLYFEPAQSGAPEPSP
jgi:hypothetical protein